MFTTLLDAIDIKGRLITADALLTQRKLADYVVVERGADYHFTAKGNQARLQEDIAVLFQNRKAPDFTQVTPPDHGRIETRRIWCSQALNEYLDFPHVAQVFLIEREVFHKKSGKQTLETSSRSDKPDISPSHSTAGAHRQSQALDDRESLSLRDRLELR